MDRLPSEILHAIFIRLDLQQRLVCLLVCRTWYHLLEGGSLFYNVTLREKDEQFSRMMAMFEHSPHRAFQVEELHIVLETDTLFNRRELLNIFPNARVISVIPHNIAVYSIYSTHRTPIDLTHSKSRIESLSDFSSCELADQILLSQLGGRLKTLYLNFCRVRHSSSNFEFSQLKDLPVLKKLSLKTPRMHIEDLEAIHRNIPSIEDFTLEAVVIKTGSPMPSEIIPATRVTKLDYYYGEVTNKVMYAQLHKYMTKKYINMTEIEYAAPGLSAFDANDRRYIYLNGLLDFLQAIGRHRNELTLCNLPDGVDPFEALDAVDSQIKTFRFSKCDGVTLFQYLSQSNQSKHLEQLKIDDTSIDSIYPIKGLINLTQLSVSSLDSNAKPVHLNKCLDACPPSLKTLTIYCYKLTADPFKTTLDSIEILDIGFLKLPGNLGDIISFCLPNLVKLKLTGEVVENIAITLKSPHFQEAVFSTREAFISDYSGYGFAFSSPNQTETQYYFCGQEGEKTRVQCDELQGIPTLSVVSLTEKILDINNTIQEIKVLSC